MMKLSILPICVLALIAFCAGTDARAGSATPVVAPVDISQQESDVPLAMPGYELRQMDIGKRITFDVQGRMVDMEIPIFVYVPTVTTGSAIAPRRFREIYNRIVKIASEEPVDRVALRRALDDMDRAIEDMLGPMKAVAGESE